LNIDQNRIYYNNLDFIEVCEYSNFFVSKYDTSLSSRLIIERRYSKLELSKILEFTTVDKDCKRSCYNDCAQFYLKQDTLMYICGGYTFFLLKTGDMDHSVTSTR